TAAGSGAFQPSQPPGPGRQLGGAAREGVKRQVAAPFARSAGTYDASSLACASFSRSRLATPAANAFAARLELVIRQSACLLTSNHTSEVTCGCVRRSARARAIHVA